MKSERYGGRVPAGLWARVVQRLLALNAAIWHNWLISAPVKRSLIAYGRECKYNGVTSNTEETPDDRRDDR